MNCINRTNTLAIVPARGGSKRLRRKNLYPLLGKPMIQYSLDILKKLADNVTPFISTEDEEIFQYCLNQGFSMPYRRPKNLAEDDTSIIDVILDTVNWYESKKNLFFEVIVLLQPTSPDRCIEDVIKGLSKFKEDINKSVVSIQPMLEPPEECITIEGNGSWTPLLGKSPENHNSQNFSNNYYFIDGSIYIASVNHLRNFKSFIVPKKTNFLFLDKRWPVDIDFLEDLEIAEAIMKKS